MAHHKYENPQGENPDVQGCTNAAERRMRGSGLPLRHFMCSRKWLVIGHENPEGETRIAGSDSERRKAAARRAKDRTSGVILTYMDVLMPCPTGK